jgi:nicotinamide phosphoribosyltransferase
MGGALHQHVNRDTCRFAMKCSAVLINGVWHEVSKNPITDPGKRSKAGRLTTRRDPHSGALSAALLPATDAAGPDTALQTVWSNGQLLLDQTLAEIRARTAATRAPLSESVFSAFAS